MATTETSIKAYLDSLSQLPGSILVRNEVSWQGLAPGNNGQVLTLDSNNMPTWTDLDAYSPAWMQFANSSARYYRNNFSTAGPNKITIVGRVQINPSTADRYPFMLEETSGAYSQPSCFQLRPSNHSTYPNRMEFRCTNAANTSICRLLTAVEIADGAQHSIFAEFDGDTGQARLLVDNQNADDPSYPARVVTTGTMHRGAGSYLGVAAGGTGNVPANGLYQHFGAAFVSGLDPDDFHTSDGKPKNIEADIAGAWGGALPLIWQESAKFDQNEGSYPNLTAGGTILLSNEPV